MSNSDATKNKVITEKWRFTCGHSEYTITVGKKTVRLIHISVDLYAHLHMPIEGDSEY